MIVKSFTARDGKNVYYREWTADSPKGLVQIVHGMAESSDRYNAFAEHMAKNGYTVFADDHRGHGKTDGCSGYDKGDMFFNTLTDVAELSDKYKNENPNLPLIIVGHSYGSFLTQAYLERFGDKIDGAVVGGSALMKGALITAGGIISSLGCFFGLSKKPAKLLANMSFGSYNKKFTEGTFISSIKEECEIYEKHPDCGFTLSYNFYKHFFKGLKTLYKKNNYLNIPTDKPIMLIAGKDDPVGDMGKSVQSLYGFYTEIVGVESVDLVLYEGVRHEYFNDTSRYNAFNKVLEFCDGIIGAKIEE